MNIKLNLRKLLIILFSVSVILLIVHLALSFFYSGKNAHSKSELSSNEIDKKFKESLYSFAIKEEWIKAVNDKTNILTYKIIIPSDLPIAQILGELTKQFEDYDLSIAAEEKKINGITLSQILSANDIKLKAEFRYDKEIQRKENRASLFIYGRENREADYDSLMLNTTRDMSALLLPSKSNSIYSNWLWENGFDYAVMLNNDIVDLEFRLKDDFSEKRLKLIAQNLVVAFPHALFYVIDKNSNIYESKNYSILKKEFDKRKICFFTAGSLKFIDNNQANLEERFSSIVRNAKADEITRVALSLDSYKSLTNELMKLTRIGYKFVKQSEQISEFKK